MANARFFGGDIQKVPRMALTVGVGTVLDAEEVLVIITGTHKAYALAKCIEEGVNHMFTVSAIQMHPKAVIVCDEDATLELRVSRAPLHSRASRLTGCAGARLHARGRRRGRRSVCARACYWNCVLSSTCTLT